MELLVHEVPVVDEVVVQRSFLKAISEFAYWSAVTQYIPGCHSESTYSAVGTFVIVLIIL
jgi:hypothetical protein